MRNEDGQEAGANRSACEKLTRLCPLLQNLIPLILLRPLRLLVPAEQLRGARIMVLKGTHLPYVFAIWAYESACRRLIRRGGTWQPRSNGHSHSSPPIFTRHLSSSGKRGHPALRSTSEPSLAQPPVADVPELRPSRANVNDLSDLKQMISKLSQHVDELTLRLDRQR